MVILEEGKIYVMRNGDLIGPMFVWTETMDWHEFHRDGINSYGYDAFGCALSGRADFDIVEGYRPVGSYGGKNWK